MPNKNIISIKADPTKNFFIDMLTRDIGLIDCILDLIDNSIDSIIKKTGFNPMRGLFYKKKILNEYEIAINFNGQEFVINDNSGGMKKDEIKDHAFRFGVEAEENRKKGLSVYGIGMKRAFLKIGKNIFFESTDNKNTTSVKIDVNKWIKEKGEWLFSGEVMEKKKNTKLGTKIKITNLNEQASFNFSNNSFRNKLSERIGEVYGIFISNGLTIKIDNKKIEALIPNIATSKDLKPAIDTFEKDGVKVKIIAGVSHEKYKEMNGWYIFCNGRLILSSDKTEKTGWGVGVRRFHPSTNRFVGFVYFESDDVAALPWTTTKDGVNIDSTLYQYVLKEMVKIAKPIIAFLIRQYGYDPSMEEFRKLLKQTKEVSLEELTINKQNFKAPLVLIDETSKKKISISYFVPKSDMEIIKKIIKNESMSNSEIGKMTFYYYIKYEK